MTKQKKWTALLAALAMLALILDGKTAMQGAAEGIELCIRTVIPSLFPFLFLCSLLTGALWGGSYPWLRPVSRGLGIPEGGESLLIAATLGGYPAGAQAVGQAWQQGRLEQKQAEHLLRFCSNAGPAFLFGMAARQFPDRYSAWGLWCIQILSAGIVGALGAAPEPSHVCLSAKGTDISQNLVQTIKTMAVICGWILLFRILSDMGKRWLFCFFRKELQVTLTGILELSYGCCCLNQIESLPLRFFLCSGLLAFGGLCVTMQTACTIGTLPLRPYLRGKLLQTGIALGLSALYLTNWRYFLLLAGGCVLTAAAIPKKSSGFSGSWGV